MSCPRMNVKECLVVVGEAVGVLAADVAYHHQSECECGENK